MSDLVFCLMGPTASGKTDLACELVQLFPFEIISVDSAMIYRGMDIGTAKPDKTVLDKAPHHLIDILNPPEIYSAANFCQEVNVLCKAIIAKNKIPLLVGGTMMYFRALQTGLAALPEADEATREALLVEASAKGWDCLYEQLQRVDPSAALRIHPHDTQRLQRALEIFRLTGKPLSHYLNTQTNPTHYQFVNIGLLPDDRSWLHARIAQRFNQMLQQGFVEEVESLINTWQLDLNCPAMRSVGYRQVISYLQGELPQEALAEKAIAATRQLAKRQLTWLRHWQSLYPIIAENPQNLREIVAIIQQVLDNRLSTTRLN